jgi:hypothetical protein
VVSLLAGCNPQAEIKQYQVPHESPVAKNSAAAPAEASSASAQRMLAAIVPVDSQAWFIKAVGPTNQVDQIASEFQQLLKSLKFDSPDKPQWTLPSGWSEQPGNQFRYATLMARGVEVSVSTLPLPGGSATPEYILSNVNRWRGQLQLPAVDVDQLRQTTRTEELAGRQGVLVDLSGTGSSDATNMRAPFAGGNAGNAGPATTPAIGDSAEDSSAGGLTYTKPADWQEGRRSSFRLASFTIEQNGGTAEVTVIALGSSAGSLLDNVNRWRGQINLPPVGQDQLDKQIGSLDVDGIASQYIRITEPSAGATQSILAVIVPRPNQTVFIKMMGPSELVLGQQADFEKFVRSLRFAAGS